MRLKEKSGYKLTIGYTTYNRKDLITRRLNKLLSMDIPENIEIIIIDNASSDGTFETISDLTHGTNIKVYRNNKNLGYSGNFVETFRRAKGNYVMWTSDKDEINLNGVQKLFDWIEKETKADLIILNYFRKMELRKYHVSVIRKNKTRVINYDDLWGCSHTPGSIYKRSVALEKLNDWDEIKKMYPETSKYYPNLLLAIQLIPSGNSYFLNENIANQMEYAKFSYHAAKPGNHYSHVISRWLQHKELISFIELCVKRIEDPKHKKYLKKMCKSLNRNLYDYILIAMRREQPSLSVYFSSACNPFNVLRRNYNLIKTVFNSFLESPSITIYRIKERIRFHYSERN